MKFDEVRKPNFAYSLKRSRWRDIQMSTLLTTFWWMTIQLNAFQALFYCHHLLLLPKSTWWLIYKVLFLLLFVAVYLIFGEKLLILRFRFYFLTSAIQYTIVDDSMILTFLCCQWIVQKFKFNSDSFFNVLTIKTF